MNSDPTLTSINHQPARPPADPPAASSGGEGPAAAALLASIPCACFALDNEWRFTYANRPAERFFEGLSGRKGPFLGLDIRQEFPEVADSAFVRQRRQALSEQGAMEEEVFYPGLNRWFAVNVWPAGEHLCVIIRDTNEQTRLRQDVLRRTQELADADRGKDQFLLQLAHEVRNSLATVRNALHVVGTQDLGADGQQACVLAGQAVRHLSELMDDLLQVSQAVQSPPKKERINVASVVARALSAALSGEGASGRNLSVHLPQDPIWLDADPSQIEQALGHLLSNAVKYTRQGGAIRLSVEREEQEVVVRVEDDGVGIKPEVLPHAFNLFMREREPGGFQGGLGVGLTLVRRFVEAHGGSAEAHSAGVNCGSEFVIRLPVAEEKPTRPRPAPESPDGDGSQHVLVVDDSSEVTQSLALLLGRWGCEVRVANDGAAALEAVGNGLPDVVLLDIGMPGMDGYEVARALRQCEGGDRLILVALTGYGKDEDRNKALEAGFDYHMVKPVDPGDLKDLLAYVRSNLQHPGPAR